jgi:hypothetical protein
MDGPRAVLVGLGVVVLLVVVVGAGTSAAAFDVFNQGWDGTSELRSRADDVATGTTVLVDTDQYASVPANDSVALVLSPETGFEIDEVGDVSAFVRRGGTLVVAEDFGQHGGALLAGVGASAAVSESGDTGGAPSSCQSQSPRLGSSASASSSPASSSSRSMESVMAGTRVTSVSAPRANKGVVSYHTERSTR